MENQNAAREDPQTGKRKSRNRAVTVILIAVLAAGLGVLLYPAAANRWNERVQTRAVESYSETVYQLDESERDAFFAAAQAYNEALVQKGSAAALAAPDSVPGYRETLDITGTGIMGYVTIDRISVQLPIYHGTSDSVLQAGAGHLEGSSFPIGGENTHSVISAHRGLPSAKLFTALDRMEVGDRFTVTVLDRVLTYEVDRISIVLPEEMESVTIVPGMDYCTLMTCTPYGINTHRLLVRGVRSEDDGAYIQVEPEADQVNTLLVAAFVAVPLLIILFIWLIVSTGRKKNRLS